MHDRPNVPRASASAPTPPRTVSPVGDHPVARHVATDAVRRSVTAIHEAQARRRRATGLWCMPDDETDDDAPSFELVRLLDHLRTALATFVGAQRDEGRPVERVLAQVQGLVREAALLDGFEPMDRLTHHVVRWTIQTYYDRPELRGAPQFY